MGNRSLSRRGFVGAALAAVPLLSARGLAEDSARTAAASDPAGHLSIVATINGRGPFHFVVDTGADRSVLADTTAAALGLRPAGPVDLAGIVRTVRTDTVEVASLGFGALTCRDLRLPILPRSQLAADGYLGLDVLDGNRVILDFEAHTLIVTDPLPTILSVYGTPDVTVLPAQGGGGHLRSARCSVDRHPVAAFIDTGAQSSMGNEALYRALVAADPALVSHTTVALTGLTGGTAIARLTTPRQATLGRLTIGNCPIAVADLQVFDLWGLAGRPALLIGMNWLRRFKRVSIDYGRKELRFEVGSMWYGLTASSG